MASVGDVKVGPNAISKYVSASEDFSTYASGDTVIGTIEWDEPRFVHVGMLACNRTVALANGTSSKMAFEFKLNPTGDTWRASGEIILNNATVAGTFNGLTWANANTACETGGVWAWTSNANSQPLGGPLCYGVRLRANVNAGDTTIAGTITNVWIGAAFI